MTVKSMLVQIGVDTKGLEAGFKKADSYMQSHKAQFRKAGMAMTAAGAAVVGSIGLMVKGYVSAGDEVHKMAQRTGFTTEALSELKYAAEISGADINSLEKGVKRMSKTITDAGEGMATYIRSFDRIGISVQDLQGLNPEQQFDKIATAIAAVEDPTIRAATAQDIFGRAGTQLLPLFAAGADGLEELRQKARDMGIVFDQEAADKAAALQDAMTTLKGSFKGVTNTIAETLVPIITKVVGKISDIVIKVKDWMKEHPKLGGTIVKVVLVIGGLMAVLGPLVMILPALVSGLGLLGGAFSALLGPIGLVIAAVAVGVGLFLKLAAAKDTLKKATERLEETETHLKDKLLMIAKAAGMTGEEFGQLTKKYKGNWIQMALAIKHGEEGVEMQQAMTEEGKKRVKQQEDEKAATIDVVGAMKKYNKKAVETSTIVKTMTDEIKKATLDEYEYSKWALEEKYKAREAAILKEIEAGKVGADALKLMQEAKLAEMAEIDKADQEASLERAKEHAEKVKEVWNAFWEEARLMQENYLTLKAELTDSINKLTKSELDYTIWALDEDFKKREQHIKDTIEGETERDELLKLLHEDYLLKKEKAQKDHGEKMTEIEKATLTVMGTLWGNFCTDMLDAFEAWGAGTMSLIEAVGEVFKGLITDMLQGLKDLVVQELLTATKTILAEKAKGIAKIIVAVMAAIPFPLNLVVVGGAIAAVTALFNAIKLGEGGVISKPTPVVAGERGPEIYMPLNKYLSTLGPGVGGAVTIRQTNYFYGDIKNVGDIDEISDRLARRTIRMIERGRRP